MSRARPPVPVVLSEPHQQVPTCERPHGAKSLVAVVVLFCVPYLQSCCVDNVPMTSVRLFSPFSFNMRGDD